MNCCKLFVVASILFFGGVYGQFRFQRHLEDTTATTTQNESEHGLAEVNGLNRDGELTSDYGDVVLEESGETVEVELLKDDQLELQVCSDGCSDRTVMVCYDAVPGKIKGRGECREFNQCGIQAGVRKEEGDEEFFWYMFTTPKIKVTGIQMCAEAVMKYPTTRVTGSLPTDMDSCDPLKHDGNVVKLYVQQVFPGCSIKVLNAKRWFPATTAPPTTLPPPSLLWTPVSSSNENESSSSNADTTWGIVGGILAGIFVLVILGCIGFCVYRNHKQKKDAAAKAKAEHELKYASLESLPTLDLATTTTAVQKEEKEKPKKEDVVKKDKSEKKKKNKKVEVAPAPPKVMASKEASVPAKALTSKEATSEKLKIEASKEKAATKVEDVQKEKKGAAKETPINAKKVVEKVAAVARPPPPPHRKAATPKRVTVDKTQEESPSIGKQDALEDVPSSPSMERKAPKKAPPKKATKKLSKKKYASPSTPPSRGGRRHSSKKLSTRRREMQKYGLNSEEWKDFEAQMKRRPGKVVEWNPSASSSNY